MFVALTFSAESFVTLERPLRYSRYRHAQKNKASANGRLTIQV